jgi:peptidoglycan-associated lipoprotein
MKLNHVRLNGLVMIALSAAVVLSGCSRKTSGVTSNPDINSGTSTGTGGNPSTDPNSTESERSGNSFGLNDIYFQYDDHSLSGDARATLSANASRLRELGSVRVTLEGHCDERGTTEYNLALGQRRADAARSYLIDLGIESSRLATVSYGEERPFENGHNESAWSQNRRVHFTDNTP